MIVAAVSYLNTVPFIWGINQAAPSLRDTLTLAIPAKCATLFNSKQADIALIPVGALNPSDKSSIITNYCLSAENEVETVALLSNCKLNDIQEIFLDTHSRTSVKLARILAREKWNITPQWTDNIPQEIKPYQAIVAIGDKVFEIQKNFTHKWDLAQEWIEMTGMPFVFAVWVAQPHIKPEIIEQLNNALKLGTQNIDKALLDFPTLCPNPSKYLNENIKYNLTQPKIQAIELFWEKQITPG